MNSPHHQHPTRPPVKLQRLPLCVAFACLSLAPAAWATGEFDPLGDLAGGAFHSEAVGVSGDGTVVAGNGVGVNGGEGFRWTQAGGMVTLGDLPGGGIDNEAYGISSDGSTIVGYGTSSSGIEAMRWTLAGGMVGLGDLVGGSTFSIALGTSSDGSVVVGRGAGVNGTEAFRWTQAGGMVGLGDLAGGVFSSVARGTNSDGSVVVGYGSSANGTEAFRWTQAGGMVGLGDFAGGTFSSVAFATNSDGSVVVGYGNNARGQEAFRWTQAGGMVGLGVLPGGINSAAQATNSDGNVVVGSSNSHIGNEAFRWTQAGGIQRVADWLATAGVSTAPGYTLINATGVSADGSVVVGSASGPNGTEAYLARVVSTGPTPPEPTPGSPTSPQPPVPATSSPGSGIINPVRFMGSVFGASETFRSAQFLLSQPFEGSHHRPLASYGELTEGHCAWINGDFAQHERGQNAKVSQGEAGVCGDWAEGSVRTGLGIGQSYVRQDLPFSGNNTVDGQYLIGEIDWRLPDTQLLLSATVMAGNWQADISRGYENGAAIDRSRGKPDVTGSSWRLRADWLDAFALPGVTPWVSFTQARSRIDGYTETGGGFPARFEAQTHTAEVLRAGLTTQYALRSNLHLHTTLETAHRLDSRGPDLSGQVLGLFSFSRDGEHVQRDWQRVSADLDYRLSPSTLLSFSLQASTPGEDPDYSGGVRVQFGY